MEQQQSLAEVCEPGRLAAARHHCTARVQGHAGSAWEPQQAAAPQEGGGPPLLVAFPASLEWHDVACQVHFSGPLAKHTLTFKIRPCTLDCDPCSRACEAQERSTWRWSLLCHEIEAFCCQA